MEGVGLRTPGEKRVICYFRGGEILWNTTYLPLQFREQHHVLYVWLVNGDMPSQICCELWSRSVPLRVTTQILRFWKHRSCLKRQDLVISSPLPSFERFWCKVQQAMIQQTPFYRMAMDTFRRDGGDSLHLWWLVPSISFGAFMPSRPRGMVLRCGCSQCSLAKLGSTLRMKIYCISNLKGFTWIFSGNYGSNWKVRICGFDEIVFFFCSFWKFGHAGTVG